MAYIEQVLLPKVHAELVRLGSPLADEVAGAIPEGFWEPAPQPVGTAGPVAPQQTGPRPLPSNPAPPVRQSIAEDIVED